MQSSGSTPPYPPASIPSNNSLNNPDPTIKKRKAEDNQSEDTVPSLQSPESAQLQHNQQILYNQAVQQKDLLTQMPKRQAIKLPIPSSHTSPPAIALHIPISPPSMKPQALLHTPLPPPNTPSMKPQASLHTPLLPPNIHSMKPQISLHTPLPPPGLSLMKSQALFPIPQLPSFISIHSPHILPPSTPHEKLSSNIMGGNWQMLPKEAIDNHNIAEDLSDQDKVEEAAQRHLEKKITLFKDLCEHCNTEEFKSICQKIQERDRNQIKALNYFLPKEMTRKNNCERAHISIIPRFTVINSNQKQYEYTDVKLYEKLNAIDYVPAIINRIDDEIEYGGRIFAIRLLNKIIKKEIEVNEAVNQFKDYINQTLEKIISNEFHGTNISEQQKEEAKQIASTIKNNLMKN